MRREPLEKQSDNLRPGLIPLDVLHAVEREAAEVVVSGSEVLDLTPSSGLQPLDDAGPTLTHRAIDESSALALLSEVDLFRELPGNSLRALARHAVLVDVADGDVLFYEGEAANAFYVVTEGHFEVVRHKDGRDIALRHDGRGAALGLFGLFSAQLRAATARAIGDSTVLQVPALRLQALLEDDDALNDRLLRFYRQRLVEGFVASKLFADLDGIARARLIGRFKSRTYDRGDSLLQPGEVANLLAVVTHGRLMLEERMKVGSEPKLSELLPGQFLAVTSAMTGQPLRLRVFAPQLASVELINHKDFVELMKDYPALRSLPKRLPQFGRQLDRDIFCGGTGVPGL